MKLKKKKTKKNWPDELHGHILSAVGICSSGRGDSLLFFIQIFILNEIRSKIIAPQAHWSFSNVFPAQHTQSRLSDEIDEIGCCRWTKLDRIERIHRVSGQKKLNWTVVLAAWPCTRGRRRRRRRHFCFVDCWVELTRNKSKSLETMAHSDWQWTWGQFNSTWTKHSE